MFITEKEYEHEKRFAEEEIIQILKEAEVGLPIKELCRKHNISDITFYTWRKQYGGLDVSEARRKTGKCQVQKAAGRVHAG